MSTPDLFTADDDRAPARADAPLADRMRPRSFEELVGQDALLAPGRPLRVAIERDLLQSIILWGPPGTGKTTLARLIAHVTRAHFISFSAVLAGIKEIKAVMAEAELARRQMGRRTILFVDEIHRFNKAQQDAFLPRVEAGDIVLIGATTENPSFEVNSALLSRSQVYVLEAAVLAAPADTATGRRRVDTAFVEMVAQRRMLLYDKNGEEHYNLISALHKSMRNSDPDAALYWLARMVEAGEDPLYIARRLVRFASEDVGVADPQALVVAVAVKDAVHFIGMPEGNNALAQAVVYLSTAPKSNALYIGYGQAAADALHDVAEPVPLHLRNAPTRLMKQLDYGKGYRYAHEEADAVTGMECLPERLRGRRYYRPTERGFEKEIKRRLDGWEVIKEKRRKTAGSGSRTDDGK